MYIDLGFLLLMYVFSASAALIGVYALWRLNEVEDILKAYRKQQIARRLESIVNQTKPRAKWPPK